MFGKRTYVNKHLVAGSHPIKDGDWISPIQDPSPSDLVFNVAPTRSPTPADRMPKPKGLDGSAIAVLAAVVVVIAAIIIFVASC